jgi:ABC-type Fe3+/spermidine/putrescine transport system ATPase subunit
MGTPEEVYECPRSTFVAEFIGANNLFAGRVESVKGDSSAMVCLEGMNVTVSVSGRARVGDAVTVALRPERVRLAREGAREGTPVLRGTIANAIFMGASVRYYVELAGSVKPVVAYQPKVGHTEGPGLVPGDRVAVGWDAEALQMLRS